MEPITAAAIAGAGILGGIFAGQEQRRAQEAALNRMLERLDRVYVPSLEELDYIPQQYAVGPSLQRTPLTSLYLLGPSALEDIQLDPSLRADYLTALDQARTRALRGFTEQDQALLAEYLNSIAQQQQAAQQQVLQDAQRRGVADSGQQLVAALQGSQAATNQGSRAALQAAAMRLQQQQLANQQLGELARMIEQSDYERALNLAKQQDFIQKFNKELQQEVARQNMNLKNQDELLNWQRGINVSDRNVDLANRQKEQRAENRRWRSSMELQRATGMVAPYTNLANFYGNQANAISGGVTTAVLGGLDIYNQFSSNQKPKSGGTGSGSGGGGQSEPIGGPRNSIPAIY